MERPYIDYKKCTSCGTCINVCPVSVFAKEGKKTVVKNPGDCIQCRACEASCPEKAIQVK
ncbi:MAG: 4Fe-4S binding protein [Candidatus ainarchaeum sp.]|nr:4Fe-4S binding protein [Candidatus ainarchaeum sp.]